MPDSDRFRSPPEGVYRLIEIDSKKQNSGSGGHPEESEFTKLIGDYTDWDEAVQALRQISSWRYRRQLWGARGILGVYGKGQFFIYERLR
jgi:hypothetical protein